MALSMEEQRILAEIEQELVRSEPMLAACLTMFSRPGRSVLLRPPRSTKARSPWPLAVASLAALVMLTVMPVVIYALVALHGAPQGRPAGHPAASSASHAVTPQPLANVPR
jgi:Protein of unknown function (DUF3040)